MEAQYRGLLCGGRGKSAKGDGKRGVTAQEFERHLGHMLRQKVVNDSEAATLA